MSKVGRNDQCPCGSGKKAKRCHEEVVGHDPGNYFLRLRISEWQAEMQDFIEHCTGYVPPMSTDERLAYMMTGCPFGTCENQTDNGQPCAALNCGV